MTDWLALAVVVLAVVATFVLLFGFAGCDVVFGLHYIPPAGPNLSKGPVTANSITVNWDPDTRAIQVELDRSLKSDPTQQQQSFVVPRPGTSLLDPGPLDPDTEYEYKARFKNQDGEYSQTTRLTVKTDILVVRPTFDSVGVGAPATGNTSATTSWIHTAGTGQVAVVVALRWQHSGAGPATAARTATYGGAAMTSSGVIGLNDAALNATSGEYAELFILPSVPAGPSQVRITVNRNGLNPSISIEGCSISYLQAAAFDPVTPIAGGGPGTSLMQGISSADNATVVQMFGTNPGAVGSYSQTSRHQGTVRNFVIGDANGGNSVQFVATRIDGAAFAGLAVRLTPGP
ncbi:fibronectin type III domain-containing protein [Smaragdicoccus niigatensis]|uniref:fibronectin type III domain-containing protein n=1 Tax=Smaragdicoccus niigatensis TaxID=359359 RepID=UPI00037352F6|nr:fibronectin type III domain-containing protein [Smaragdicoccus niigatensis]